MCIILYLDSVPQQVFVMITHKTPCCPTERLCVGAYHSVTVHTIKNVLDLAGDLCIYLLIFLIFIHHLLWVHFIPLYIFLELQQCKLTHCWYTKGIILSYLNLSYLTLFFATLWENGQVPSAFLHVPRRNLHRNSKNTKVLL